MLEQPVRDHDIAIIAMAGRFPGAPNVATLWRNLADSVESFAQITPEDIAQAGRHGFLANHPDYVWRRPVLDDIKGFDAQLFGWSPREAMITDPQNRIFLECAYEALEAGGYGRTGDRGRVGVFAGNNISMYLQERFNDPDTLLRIDHTELIVGNEKDSLTTVVAYRLDLTGPAVSVQTFCSTSPVAIHMACQSVRNGECDMALAGGVSMRVPDRVGYIYVEGGMDLAGRPRPHVRRAGPRRRVRRRLGRRAAQVDAAGHRRSGHRARRDPRFGDQQRRLVEVQLHRAERRRAGPPRSPPRWPTPGSAPHDISYVEAHGTATELGDPIEVAALTRAFRAADRAHRKAQYCPIGSVKTNVGHLDRAAAVTGLIKWSRRCVTS